MSRHFGMVSVNIWASAKFIALKDDTSRLAYLYLHTCQHGNANGCFRLPPQYLGADLDVRRAQALEILQDLEAVGLIAYDTGENILLIRGFFTHNKITNHKHLLGSIKSFETLPKNSPVVAALSLEIIASGYEQAEKLNEKGRSQVQSEHANAHRYGQQNLVTAADILGTLSEFVTAQKRERGDLFEAAIESLSIPLPEALSIDLCIHRNRDLNTETETNTEDGNRGQRTEDRGQRTDIKGVAGKIGTSARTPPDPSPRKGAVRGASTGKKKPTGAGAAAKSPLGKG